MIEREVTNALRRIGGRGDALGRCPLCGRPVSSHQNSVRVWSGTYAHGRCASYEQRHTQRRGSH